MSPDFELFKIGHNVGVIYNGKPDVGAVTDISFRSAGGRQPAFTPATRSVTYTVRLVTGESVTRNAEQVYHLPADKVEAAAIAGNVEAKRQKLHHGQRVKQQQQETVAAHPKTPKWLKCGHFVGVCANWACTRPGPTQTITENSRSLNRTPPGIA
jgi:hypothetical protein